MSSRAPIAIHDQAIAAHPALQAWSRLDGRRRNPVAVEVWREMPGNQPASVYRLVFRGGEMPALFAKHGGPAFSAVERTCYEAILPRVGITSPEYHGSLQDADGSWWLFVEDVGRTWYSSADPEHRRLAGTWVGRLHREGARIAAGSTLPPAGPARYLGHLRSARARIERNFANPGLSESDRRVLREVLAQQDDVEARWARIERACAGPPATVVHGDFQPKNIRVRPGSRGAELSVLDWEMAGWGNPAVDLAAACRADASIQVDPDAYAAEIGAVWPAVDAAAVRRLAVFGFTLRCLAAMDWTTESLHFERPDILSDPVESLRFLRRSLSRGLEAGREWLA